MVSIGLAEYPSQLDMYINVLLADTSEPDHIHALLRRLPPQNRYFDSVHMLCGVQ